MSSNRNEKKDDSKSNYLLYGGLLCAGIVAVGAGWYFLNNPRLSHSSDQEYGRTKIVNAPTTTGGKEKKGETGASSGNRGGEEDEEEEEEVKNIELPRQPTTETQKIVETAIAEKDQDTIRKEHYEEMAKRFSQLKRWNYKNGTLQVDIIKAENVDKKDLNSESDPFVELVMGNKTLKTKWLQDEKNPVWNETFQFTVNDATRDVLRMQLYDYNTVSNTKIGDQVQFPVIDVVKRDGVIEPFGFKVPGSKTSKLYVSLKYRED